MAICLICNQHDGQKIEEFPDQRFCGCNYDRWLQRANNIKIKRIEHESGAFSHALAVSQA